MPLNPIDLSTLDLLYNFVESSVIRTGLILEHDAPLTPWARAVSSAVGDVQWLYPAQPLNAQVRQHILNFAHIEEIEKGFVLLEMGQVVKAIDVGAIGGSAQPHNLEPLVRAAFTRRRQTRTEHQSDSVTLGGQDPYAVIAASASDSDEEIKRKYKQAMMEYHPDRVAHLGKEIRELADRKTTLINEAFALIRKSRNV